VKDSGWLEERKMTQKELGDRLVVGLAQIAPVWLDRQRTVDKILEYVHQAAEAGCSLVTFGEGVLPGYPFWIDRTDGAQFNSPVQKEFYAHYLYIDRAGVIQSVHRKLMPTYEERLVWAQGDGNGLRTHRLESFTIGGLNCWENWIPLARAALYGQGEDLHVAVWPGNARNTHDITRFMAKEGRSYVISVSGLMRLEDIPSGTPHRSSIVANSTDFLADGGSCIAGPDGQWVVEPVVEEERLILATLDHKRVREERQNFDPAGHYARPDVLQLTVNRQRQSTIDIID
jgi:nitrilase